VIDRRREPRIESSLSVLIWGLDAQGLRFAQPAFARNISGNGALLSGVECLVRPGDLIGVQHGAKRARFRVVWARDSGNGEKIRVAVQKLESEGCPWPEELNDALRLPWGRVPSLARRSEAPHDRATAAESVNGL